MSSRLGLLSLLAVLASLSDLAAANSGRLAVTVQSVASADGHVLVAACSKEAFLTAECVHTGLAPAQDGAVTVMIEDIPSGTYAVQVFHDANDNFDLDRNMIGMPLEGFGFSNDAPMRFGPPRFKDAAITVDSDLTTTSLTMRYLESARAPSGS